MSGRLSLPLVPDDIDPMIKDFLYNLIEEIKRLEDRVKLLEEE